MAILFFIDVPSLRCLETLKARRTLVNRVRGLGILWISHVCVR